jgi:hypothetical protein
MLQDEENDTDPGSVGGEGGTIERVEGNESKHSLGESSKSLCPPQDLSDATVFETEEQTFSQAGRVGARTGRVFPNYCPLCNMSFVVRKPFPHCFPTLTSLVVVY